MATNQPPNHHSPPLNQILLNRDNLLHNYHYLNSLHPTKQIAPVIKANAYGHGAIQIAPILDQLHPPFFCVNSLDEALQLEPLSLQTPILIMGYVHPDRLAERSYPFAFSFWSLDQYRLLQKTQPHAPLHLFIDTGLHREGIALDNLSHLLNTITQSTSIVGLMSHLACGDQPAHPITLSQIKQFRDAEDLLAQHNLRPHFRHLAASTGSLFLNPSQLPGNLLRPGLALYGLNPNADHPNPNLKPVLNLTSTLVKISQLDQGQTVGYDATYTAPHSQTIGLLPLGYSDGLDRRLSNQGVVTINNQPTPILGRISMNMTVVDLTNIPARLGDQVTIYSSNSTDPNSIQNLAALCQTIPYLLTTQLPTWLSRTTLK